MISFTEPMALAFEEEYTINQALLFCCTRSWFKIVINHLKQIPGKLKLSHVVVYAEP